MRPEPKQARIKSPYRRKPVSRFLIILDSAGACPRTGDNGNGFNQESPRQHAGFSLIELMVVLAIIAIIAAITYPSYERSVLKSHRSDVESLLTEDAQVLERCYTQHFTYLNCSPPLQTTSEHGYYLLSSSESPVTATSYLLTAVARGSQTRDTACRTFTLSNTGQKTALSSGGADNSSECW